MSWMFMISWWYPFQTFSSLILIFVIRPKNSGIQSSRAWMLYVVFHVNGYLGWIVVLCSWIQRGCVVNILQLMTFNNMATSFMMPLLFREDIASLRSYIEDSMSFTVVLLSLLSIFESWYWYHSRHFQSLAFAQIRNFTRSIAWALKLLLSKFVDIFGIDAIIVQVEHSKMVTAVHGL